MADISNRSSLARWQWKARNAREALSAAFAEHDQQLFGEWCSLNESTRLSELSKRLGPSPSRVIQRWATKQQFIDVLRACDPASAGLREVFVLVMDAADAGWIRVSAGFLLGELGPAACKWLSDGFIALDPVSESLLSVDVEEKHGVSTIETTLIGDGFGRIRDCFGEFGPLPLMIVNQARRPNSN